jgi:hypothetical protein
MGSLAGSSPFDPAVFGAVRLPPSAHRSISCGSAGPAPQSRSLRHARTPRRKGPGSALGVAHPANHERVGARHVAKV